MNCFQFLTHDDYKRWIAALGFRAGLTNGLIEPEFRDRLRALETRWIIATHEARFGSVPLECPDCQDGTQSSRALNCDENGNPLDGGFFVHCSEDGFDLLDPRFAAKAMPDGVVKATQ